MQHFLRRKQGAECGSGWKKDPQPEPRPPPSEGTKPELDVQTKAREKLRHNCVLLGKGWRWGQEDRGFVRGGTQRPYDTGHDSGRGPQRSLFFTQRLICRTVDCPYGPPGWIAPEAGGYGAFCGHPLRTVYWPIVLGSPALAVSARLNPLRERPGAADQRCSQVQLNKKFVPCEGEGEGS